MGPHAQRRTMTILKSTGAALLIVGALGGGSLSAQAPAAKTVAKAAAKTFVAPKTPWGDPDLQGVWTTDDMLSIPMERPEQFAGRAELTDEEFAARVKRDQQAL